MDNIWQQMAEVDELIERLEGQADETLDLRAQNPEMADILMREIAETKSTAEKLREKLNNFDW